MSKLKYPKFAIFQVRRLKKCDFSLSGELLQSRSEFEKPDAAAAVVDRVDRDDLSVRTPARMQVAADIVRRTFRQMLKPESSSAATRNKITIQPLPFSS